MKRETCPHCKCSYEPDIGCWNPRCNYKEGDTCPTCDDGELIMEKSRLICNNCGACHDEK